MSECASECVRVWLVSGDWNSTIQELLSTCFDNHSHGRFVGCACPRQLLTASLTLSVFGPCGLLPHPRTRLGRPLQAPLLSPPLSSAWLSSSALPPTPHLLGVLSNAAAVPAPSPSPSGRAGQCPGPPRLGLSLPRLCESKWLSRSSAWVSGPRPRSRCPNHIQTLGPRPLSFLRLERASLLPPVRLTLGP